jgi:hypothetical protein
MQVSPKPYFSTPWVAWFHGRAIVPRTRLHVLQDSVIDVGLRVTTACPSAQLTVIVKNGYGAAAIRSRIHEQTSRRPQTSEMKVAKTMSTPTASVFMASAPQSGEGGAATAAIWPRCSACCKVPRFICGAGGVDGRKPRSMADDHLADAVAFCLSGKRTPCRPVKRLPAVPRWQQCGSQHLTSPGPAPRHRTPSRQPCATNPPSFSRAWMRRSWARPPTVRPGGDTPVRPLTGEGREASSSDPVPCFCRDRIKGGLRAWGR